MMSNYNGPKRSQPLQRMTTNSVVTDRLRGLRALGLSFNGDRDLYTLLGYKKNPSSEDFDNLYRRQDIAGRIIKAFPQATWRENPKVYETDDENQTDFEKAIQDLDDRLSIWSYMERADRLSGIGRYGVLILGLSDAQPLDQPAQVGSELIWLKAAKEHNADIASWNQDPTSPDFGKPEVYNVTFGSVDNDALASQTKKVHKSRIIHIAEFLEEDDVYGLPRLESVMNRLQDLEKVVGGSAEMFWLGARNGLKMIADKDANLSPDEIDRLADMAEDYQHSIRRTLAAKGVDIQAIGSETPDPTGNKDAIIDLIAGATGIPKRILLGNEAGQLASSQDETNWLSRIDERRVNHVEPNVIRATLDRLIELGCIPSPTDDYVVEWDMADGIGQKERAEIGKIKADTLAVYSNAVGAELIVPVTEFREVILGLDPEPAGGFDELEDLPEDELGEAVEIPEDEAEDEA